MVKRACVDKNGIRKGEWSQEEDNLLKVHIQERGHKNWRLLPELAGLARCGKSCRLRWVNYLKPGVRKEGFTKDEVELITQLYQQIGPKWSAMAKRLPRRTDNDIKNHWHAHIKKQMNKKKSKSPVVERTADGFSLTATSTVVDDDGVSCVEKKPHLDSSAAGSSTITCLDNIVIAACDHDAADSWDSFSTQNDQLITSMDGTQYLSDHVVDMGNNQQYNCYYPTLSNISQDDLFQPQLRPKTEFSSSNSLNSGPEWMSNGDNSFPDSQAAQSVLLHQESFLMNEPAFNFSNEIGCNYQWRDESSSFAGQAQLDDGDFNYSYNLWDNGSRC